jgi:FkbM family methyltransferase
MYYMIDVFYGISESEKKKVTLDCYKYIYIDGNFIIPKNDHARANIFTDLYPNIKKYIYIYNYDNNKLSEHNDNEEIIIKPMSPILYFKNFLYKKSDDHVTILQSLHKLLKFTRNMNCEFEEQIMAIKYINPDDIVLEFGSNIGTNSCVISAILEDSTNLVTIEPCKNFHNELETNKKLNNFSFSIEKRALSKNQIVMNGWNSDLNSNKKDDNNWKIIDNISYPNFKQKYQKKFTVLVIDCEGAFYHILNDYPEILNNIRCVIIENDFLDIAHYNKFKEILLSNHFNCIYSKKLENFDFTKYNPPCKDFFYQTFIKKNI